MKKLTSPLDRRDRIIDSAVALFLEQGVASIRLIDVAKKAKVHAPLIHYYFSSLEDLHYEVVLKILGELIDFSTREKSKAGDPLGALAAYLAGPFLWVKNNPKKVSVWLYFYYMANRSKRFEDLNTKIRDTGRERIALMLYRGLESKTFSLPFDWTVPETALHIQMTLTGNAIMFCTEAQLKSFDQAIQQQEAYIFSLLSAKDRKVTPRK